MTPPSIPETTAGKATKRLEVVVADDFEEVVDLIGKWLEAAGHTVSRAFSGRELVRLAAEKPFDLVVTDMVMPDGDGWDAILVINRLHPATRILAISGGGDYMSPEDCLRVAKGMGADWILRKPFERAQFFEAVERAMGQRPAG